MAPKRDLTPAQFARLHSTTDLSLVAYFHPRPPLIGDLIAKLVEISCEHFGDLRVSGSAARRIPYDTDRFLKMRQKEIREIMYLKLPSTLGRFAEDSVVTGLNAGTFDACWLSQVSRHKPSGLRKEVWHLGYYEQKMQYRVALDPYLHLCFQLDHFDLPAEKLMSLIRSFFTACAATKGCYGGLADPGRWRDLMGRCYHDFIAGTVPLYRSLNQAAWMFSGARRRRLVRGVFWGTLLPPHVVKQLGGVEAISCRWMAAVPERATNCPAVAKVSSNSLFLVASSDPISFTRSRFDDDLRRSAWLHNSLREKGLLC